MLGIFRKKKADKVLSELNKGISRIDYDIYKIQQWIAHLHQKAEDIKASHHGHMDVTNKELLEVKKWINYLHAHNFEMRKFAKATADQLLDLRKSQGEIAKAHSEMLKMYMVLVERMEKIELSSQKMDKGQVRTLQRTSQGQIKDISNVMQDMSLNEILVEKAEVIDKNEFSGSHLEFINVLYHADRPMSYSEFANIVGKKEKSIRNLIHELRKKGVRIKSKPIGIRKKGFYIEREEKIRISGR